MNKTGRVAVVYWSDTGNTRQMAAIVKSSLEESGAQASMIAADDFGRDRMQEYDSFAFGCPAMGSEVLEEDSFEPMFSSVEDLLRGKKVLLFGSYDWGDGLWMREWTERTKGKGADVVDSVIAHLDEIDADELGGAAKKLI